MKKIATWFVVIALVFFTAKEIVAARAHEFIISCATDEEVDMILSPIMDENRKRAQLEIAEKTIECVKTKQNLFERLFANLMGIHLFK